MDEASAAGGNASAVQALPQLAHQRGPPPPAALTRLECRMRSITAASCSAARRRGADQQALRPCDPHARRPCSTALACMADCGAPRTCRRGSRRPTSTQQLPHHRRRQLHAPLPVPGVVPAQAAHQNLDSHRARPPVRHVNLRRGHPGGATGREGSFLSSQAGRLPQPCAALALAGGQAVQGGAHMRGQPCTRGPQATRTRTHLPK